jgi:hypothetical protein
VVHLRFNCVAALLVVAVPLFAQSAPQKPAHPLLHASKPAAAVPDPQPTPIAPLTPEQMPAAAPRVSYLNGVLTVDSQNSTLASILGAIARQTHIQIDPVPAFGSDRVAAHLSGTTRQVLTSLLDGSDLGYLMIGSPGSPDSLQKVMLIVETRNTSSVAANAPYQPPPPPPPGDAEPDLSPAEEGPTAEQMNERFPPDRQPAGQAEAMGNPQPESVPVDAGDPQAPQPMPAQPGQPQYPNVLQQQSPTPDAGQNPQNNQSQVKTPEQLLQELQRMRNGQNQNQNQNPQ